MNGDSARILELKQELDRLSRRLKRLEDRLDLARQALLEQTIELEKLLHE